jgi:hypothetical protein
VIAGTVTFKVGEASSSVHDDADGEAGLLIFSIRLADMPFEKQEAF